MAAIQNWYHRIFERFGESIREIAWNQGIWSVEVHDGGVLHFYFPDGTELEIDTEE